MINNDNNHNNNNKFNQPLIRGSSLTPIISDSVNDSITYFNVCFVLIYGLQYINNGPTNK